jgi:cytosine/adenosine deaminase-related metal-dependent hydrolase
LGELIRTGTTAVADIVPPSLPAHLWSQSGLKAAVFVELRAPTARRVPLALQAAQQAISAWQTGTESSSAGGPDGGVQLGLSPHAPYTVRLELLEAAIRLAQQYRLPVAMHLAESLEEIQLLHSGQGPLRRLLEELGQWEPGLVPAPCRPLDYLRQLAQVDRALVIHGNYLDEEEWAFLAEHRQRMAVVFCPRSHAHFDHRPYPLLEMLAWGLRVILGTDSRASAPDTDMLAEMRWVAVQFPQLAPQRILELATLEAARALGWGEQLGALAPGRRADLVAVALPEQQSTNDPYELLLGSDLPVLAVWIAGQKVFPAREPASCPP